MKSDEQQLEVVGENLRRCVKCNVERATMVFEGRGKQIKVCDNCAKDHICSLVKGHNYILKDLRTTTEPFKCQGCGKIFERRKTSNPKRFCDKPSCRCIKKLRNSVASYNSIPNSPSQYYSELKYNGKLE